MVSTTTKHRGRPRKAYESITITADEYFRKFSELTLSEREKKSMEGITKWELVTLKVILKLDYGTLAKLLNITERVIYIHHPEEYFSQIISDKIMGLVELYSYGFFIFGDMDVTCEWMLKPNVRLENLPPIDLIQTHSGLLEVRSALTDILIGQY